MAFANQKLMSVGMTSNTTQFSELIFKCNMAKKVEVSYFTVKPKFKG